MAIKINFDPAHNPIPPTFVLAKRSGAKICALQATNIHIKDCLNGISEIMFDVYKYLDGEQCFHWEDIKDFRLVWCKEWDTWFEIKVETTEIENEIKKNITGIKLGQAELSQIKLYDIEINTELDIARDDYVKPTVFFDEENPDVSLLDRIMEKAPHYRIKHVDETLIDIQKTFQFSDKSIADVHQEIAEEVGCLFVYESGSDENGKIARDISVYDLYQNCIDCDYRGEFVGSCPECSSKNIKTGYGNDTTIFVTSDALGKDLKYMTDTDSVKNCFKIEGGDDLINATVRSCNANGTEYIWHITEDTRSDMSSKLQGALAEYDKEYEKYQKDGQEYLSEMSDIKRSYNALIDKYKEETDIVSYNKLETIPDHIIGYPALMNAYYNTIDTELFLQSVMMPTSVNIDDNTATTELDRLESELVDSFNVAVANVDNLTVSIANNAVLSVAKVIVDPRFKVEITSSYLSESDSKHTWSGKFKITRYGYEDYIKNNPDEDLSKYTAESSMKSIEITNDLQTFIRQKMDKALSDKIENVSVSGIFKLGIVDFEKELKKYCLDSLLIFNDACHAALNVLIEQGISDDTNAMYESIYEPYYQKLLAIESESSSRENDIQTITGVYDSSGDLKEYGLQNYILEEKNLTQNTLDFEKYIKNKGEDLWIEFCSFRREDKYSNSNYISDGLNNAELFDKALELINVANKVIYKSAELQHSITSSLNNLLVIDKFKPIVEYFEVGNWIRVKIDGKIYKLRLLEYEIDYENIENINVVFSDVMKIYDGFSDVKSVLEKASSIASSYESVKHQATQGSDSNKRVNNWVNKGLDLTNMKIISASKNQEIQWDSNGLLMKEYFPVTDTFSDKQVKIINKGLYVTDDGWKTSRAGIGNFKYYDPSTKTEKDAYGVIADTLVGSLVLAENVGIYNKEQTITIDRNGLLMLAKVTDKNKTNQVSISLNPVNEKLFKITNTKFDTDGNILTSSNIISVSQNGLLSIGDGKFTVDNAGSLNIGNGRFTINADGVMNIGGGALVVNGNGIKAGANFTIDWSRVNDNGAYDLANTANSNAGTANSKANNAIDDIIKLVNGTLEKKDATFISGKHIYSPHIFAGKFVTVKKNENGNYKRAIILDENGLCAYDADGKMTGLKMKPSEFGLNYQVGADFYGGGSRIFSIKRNMNSSMVVFNILPEDSDGDTKFDTQYILTTCETDGSNYNYISKFSGYWGFVSNSTIDFANAKVSGLKITFG